MLAKTLWPLCLSFLEHLVSPTNNQNKFCTLATIRPWSELWSEFGLNLVWIWSEFWSEFSDHGLNFGLNLVRILVWIFRSFSTKPYIYRVLRGLNGLNLVWILVWIFRPWSEFGLNFGLNLVWIWSEFWFEFGLSFVWVFVWIWSEFLWLGSLNLGLHLI